MNKTAPRTREAAAAPFPWWYGSKQLLLAGVVVLLVAAVLIPSESAVPLGTHVVLVMAWLLVTASGLWRNALIVTGCAALLGVILGVVIRRLMR